MILKLRDGNITILNNSTPEHVEELKITYDFETGTNHYNVKLTIDDTVVQYGNNIIFKYDSPNNTINLKVELLDTHDNIMHVYTGSFNYYKMCSIGDDRLINIYKEIQKLYDELLKIKEQGEVI